MVTNLKDRFGVFFEQGGGVGLGESMHSIYFGTRALGVAFVRSGALRQAMERLEPGEWIAIARVGAVTGFFSAHSVRHDAFVIVVRNQLYVMDDRRSEQTIRWLTTNEFVFELVPRSRWPPALE